MSGGAGGDSRGTLQPWSKVIMTALRSNPTRKSMSGGEELSGQGAQILASGQGADGASATYFPPAPAVASEALIGDVDVLLEKALEKPEAFWGAHAETMEWADDFTQVCEIDPPYHKWFLGGTTNITVNCLDRHIREGFGDKQAVIYENENGDQEAFTYTEALAEVCKITNALKANGVRKGDRVVIYMPLTPTGIFSMLACARMGAIHSVVYAGMGEGALKTRIEDSRAKALLYADCTYRRGKEVDLSHIVLGALEDLEAKPDLILGHFRKKGSKIPDGHRDIKIVADAQDSEYDPDILDAEHPLFILYTSGTTGKPKGVLHVHGGYMVGVDFCSRYFYELNRDSVWWSLSDIGWIVGHSYIAYGPFLTGATQVIREGAPDFPDPGVVWRMVEKYEVTQMFASPTLLRMYMRVGPQCAEGTDRSSLRLMACAGEPLNPEAWDWSTKHLVTTNGVTHGAVLDNFWQTEVASPMLATFPIMPARPGYAGRPMPTVRAKIVDADGNPVSANGTGNLIIEQPLPYMMRTIWGDDDRYRSVWSKLLGGYVTGDLATMDEKGYVAILGRSDDVINIAGHRIGTAEVESSLVRHPTVAEAAVIGLPDEVKGARIKAFVILIKGTDPTEELHKELVAHVREDLGPIAQPSELEFVEKLPKTRSGKIMRRLLRAQELGEELGDTSTLED